MKVPYPMLRDFVQTQLSAEAVGDLLTMAGFELEAILTIDSPNGTTWAIGDRNNMRLALYLIWVFFLENC